VQLLAAMAALLGLPHSEAELILVTERPLVAISAGSVTVGRVQLAQDRGAVRAVSAAAGAAAAGAVSSSFAVTGHAARVLQSVAAAVQLAEPLLLVGEAGTGKTTLVQMLADKVGGRCAAACLWSGSSNCSLVLDSGHMNTML
jgi:midasin